MRPLFLLTILFVFIATVPIPGAPTDPLPDGARNQFGVFRYASPRRFIPLEAPRYLSANEADLAPDARVIGLQLNQRTWAFPLRLMTYHHVVNDTFDAQRLAVTYCSMADTTAVYRLDRPDESLHAGGLLGGVLVLRRVGADTLCPQIARCAVPGHEADTTSTLSQGPRPLITTWGRWKAKHPATRVLAPDPRFTLYYEAFDQQPRQGFQANPMMIETSSPFDERLQPGELVYGIARGGEAACWKMSSLAAQGTAEANLGGVSVRVRWDPHLDTAVIEEPFDGFALQAYWYAWSGFYPETSIQSPAP